MHVDPQARRKCDKMLTILEKVKTWNSSSSTYCPTFSIICIYCCLVRKHTMVIYMQVTARRRRNLISEGLLKLLTEKLILNSTYFTSRISHQWGGAYSDQEKRSSSWSSALSATMFTCHCKSTRQLNIHHQHP